MADPVSLWPVVVGGLLAMAGGLIGSGATFAMKVVESRNEKRKRRAEKFEELVAALFEYEHWLSQKRDKGAYGEDGELGVSPEAKIAAISAVYFPQFSGAIDQLVAAARSYELWMAEAGHLRLTNKFDQINASLNAVYS